MGERARILGGGEVMRGFLGPRAAVLLWVVVTVTGRRSRDGRVLRAERWPVGKSEDVERDQIDERQHHQQTEPARISRLREQLPKVNDDDGSKDEQMQGARP